MIVPEKMKIEAIINYGSYFVLSAYSISLIFCSFTLGISSESFVRA